MIMKIYILHQHMIYIFIIIHHCLCIGYFQMQFVVEYSRHIGFYRIIHYQVMIQWIETMIKCWEYDVEIQTLMNCHSCYKTCDNAKVTLQHAVDVVPVSVQTHEPCIHKYCDFQSCWTAVAGYLTNEVKSDQVLKNIATMQLCSVKIWINVDKPRKVEVD